MEADLRKVLALGELSLVCQPQLIARNRELTGFEALLHWHYPTLGSVPPSVFIPITEESGCILIIGERLMRGACQAATRWPVGVAVTVNGSPLQLQGPERFYDAVQSASRLADIPPGRLELVRAILLRMYASGIAIDDFGTNTSSLSQLQSLPFGKPEIDRSFVARIGLDDEIETVICTLAAIGAGLGMTLSEGVETPEQAAQVEAEGCTFIQGFLIGRPIPANEIEALMRQLRFRTV